MSRAQSLPLRREGVVPALVRAFVVVGGLLAWFAHLNVTYLLVPVACRWGTTWPLHAVTVVFLLPTLASGLLGWVLVRRTDRPRGGDDGRENLHLWGVSGVALSALFAVTIVAVWASNLAVDACA